MSDYTRVYFEGLGIDFDVPSVAFTIGNYSIHWYGIIIAFGFALAVLYGGRMAYKWKMSLDGMTDVLMWGTILGIICARAYYVIFEWDLYKDNPMDIFNLREGGLAIYGGIIAAIIFGIFFTKKRNLDFWAMADVIAPSVPIGQAIGRFGNFFNREAFGGYTDGLFAMRYKLSQVSSGNLTDDILANTVTVNGVEYIQVHPTFMYEALWNVGVIIILMTLRKKGKLKRRILPMYFVLYGLGRLWI